MNHDRIVQLIAVCVAAVLLGSSSLFAVRLSESVSRNRLEYAVEADKADPPEVAIGIAMGAFRGLFVNMLWMRANDLKESGKFWEAVDLAEAITKLQPRFPSVWTFHAWNMAYNISVSTKTPEERWYWVQAGVNLLRKEGIVHNPNDLLIHKELGWIFLHKIGGFMDDANVYYKTQHAIEWTEVLGAPPPLLYTQTREETINAYVAWLEPIGRAPRSLEALYTMYPGTKALLALVQSEAGFSPDVSLVREYWFFRALSESGQREVIYPQMPVEQQRLYDLVTDPANAQAWSQAMPSLRFMALRDEYNMEIDRMVRYTREYGPLDWRTPAAHGVYWVERGVEGALTRFQGRNEDDFDFLNTDRVKVQSIQEVARSGDLFFDYLSAVLWPNQRVFYVASVNPYFFETYETAVAEVQQRAGISEDQTKRVWTFYEAGFENFANDCIRFYYRRGQVAKANEIKTKMGTWSNQNVNDPSRPLKYAKPIDEFVVDEVRERISSPQVASAETFGALQGAFLSGLGAGDDEVFQSGINFARLMHRVYFDRNATQNDLGSDSIRQEIYMPRDFGVLEGTVFAATITRVDPDTAENMFANAPDRLKRFGYDFVVETFKPLYDQGESRTGVAFATAFPEPAGMEQFRIDFERRSRELSGPDVNIEKR